jgi:REP element-mobilizing transposase RayT
MGKPLAYLLTWTTYAAHLHGGELWTVHKSASAPGDPFITPDAQRLSAVRSLLKHEPVVLNEAERRVVDSTIRAHAEFRQWTLDAVNVRTNHVHVVVDPGDINPETVVAQFKAWARRRLREAELRTATEQLWAHHGSTRYLFDPCSVRAAVDYVLNRQ